MSQPSLGENARFWDRIAHRYDRITLRLDVYPRLLERLARDTGDAGRVLEVATGSGLIALELARRAGAVEAVDISPGMLEVAREKAEAAGTSNVRFVLGSAYDLDFEDAGFDVGVCSNALHCMERPELALAELHRVLRPGGLLLAPTFCHGEAWRYRLLSRLASLSGFKVYRRFRSGEVKGLVEAAGFEGGAVEVWPAFFPLAYVAARRPPTEAT